MAVKIVARICQNCGNQFNLKASRLARGEGKYCSNPCRYIGATSHGESSNRSPEYITWGNIKARCLNPADGHYPSYGGRGITICDAWRYSFKNFLADVGRRPTLNHTLDRRDNNGNYEPGNVRWATPMQQAQNRRNNHLVTFRGITQCISQWARETGIKENVLQRRLCHWSVEKSLTAPYRPNPKRK